MTKHRVIVVLNEDGKVEDVIASGETEVIFVDVKNNTLIGKYPNTDVFQLGKAYEKFSGIIKSYLKAIAF